MFFLSRIVSLLLPHPYFSLWPQLRCPLLQEALPDAPHQGGLDGPSGLPFPTRVYPESFLSEEGQGQSCPYSCRVPSAAQG